MVEHQTERRLAAILAADVVGYSRLLGADEAATLARLRTLKREVIDPLMAEHGGRVFKTTGDGLLAEFPSAVQALRCAIAIQDRLRSDASALQLRIGLHQGDVVIEGDDLLGDGVNIAARIEPLAEPGGIVISARVHEDAAGKLILTVDDLGTPELKNIAQKVRIFRVRPATEPMQPLALPDKPSLAVLPFQNMSGDPEQEYFADGMVEDITTALSRVGWFFVIARNSSFTYKGRAVDVRQAGRELGVRYVLEGGVRRAGGRVRISCQLIEAVTGRHVWADRFDGDLSDIFELQDRITESVVGAIEPSLQRAEIARASAKPTESLDAHDVFAGTPTVLPVHRGRQPRGAPAAAPGDRDGREFRLANALAARCVLLAVNHEWIALDSTEHLEAVAFARSALANSPDDAWALALAGHAIAFLVPDLEAGLAALGRAIALNPNSAQVLSSSGWVNLYHGDFETARDHFTRAIRISPLDPALYSFQTGLAFALVLGEPTDPARAFELVGKALAARPNDRASLHARIYCLVRLGRFEEARENVRQLLAIWPHFTLSAYRRRLVFRAPVADTIIGLLRLAGVPE